MRGEDSNCLVAAAPPPGAGGAAAAAAAGAVVVVRHQYNNHLGSGHRHHQEQQQQQQRHRRGREAMKQPRQEGRRAEEEEDAQADAPEQQQQQQQQTEGQTGGGGVGGAAPPPPAQQQQQQQQQQQEGQRNENDGGGGFGRDTTATASAGSGGRRGEAIAGPAGGDNDGEEDEDDMSSSSRTSANDDDDDDDTMGSSSSSLSASDDGGNQRSDHHHHQHQHHIGVGHHHHHHHHHSQPSSITVDSGSGHHHGGGGGAAGPASPRGMIPRPPRLQEPILHEPIVQADRAAAAAAAAATIGYHNLHQPQQLPQQQQQQQQQSAPSTKPLAAAAESTGTGTRPLAAMKMKRSCSGGVIGGGVGGGVGGGNDRRQQQREAQQNQNDNDNNGGSGTESAGASPTSPSRGPQHLMEEQRALNEEVAILAERRKQVLLARLVTAAPRGKLSLINLARRNLGLSEAVMLKEAISSNPHLSVLKLSYNCLGDDGASVIAGAVKMPNGMHHPTLSVLDLGFNEIGDKGVEELSLHAVAGNLNLRKLYLSGNQFGEKGAMSLAAAILNGTGLCSLHLSANRIGSSGMKAIAGAIVKNDERIALGQHPQQQQEGIEGLIESSISRMEDLHLSNTSFDSTGFIAVPGMLLLNSSVKTLCLNNNKINDNDMMLLSQALSQNKSVPLEVLRLSFNEITCQGVESLMNAVWGSPTLREIRLDNNRIQDRGAQLCAVVLTSISLVTLDLAFNRITTTGLKALMKNLSENITLQSLGLCGIPIDQNASKAVSYALAYNSSLHTLFVDNCNTAYSSQRHIVAGIVSNRRSSLRVLTGFSIGPVARTLGMPNLPDMWSNDQVLGFFRLMWHQWLLKAGRGAGISEDAWRGPAPPAAVATAAKIALSSLGSSPESLFHTEAHEKTLAQGAPVDPPNTALLERTNSGTMRVPSFTNSPDGEDSDELLKIGSEITDMMVTASSNVPTVRAPLENSEVRNRNLQWLRVHFRSLNEVGRLPFNNADLWQLHQYYFSPPFCPDADSENPTGDVGDSGEPSDNANDESPESGAVPPPTPSIASKNLSMGRALSFQALGDAFAASGMFPPSSNKRRSIQEGDGPVAKRAKSLSKPRIAYYPRVMAKIQSLGTKPMEQSLSLLRQLKYTENIIFSGKDPYTEVAESRSGSGGVLQSSEAFHADVEMILLDLL